MIKIPILWAMNVLTALVLSVPFWICWTFFGIGQKYFYFVPAVYQHIPFWNCVGLFIISGIIKGLIPQLISITQKTEG